MAVTINANTSTGFIATSDTSGVLQLQTGGTTAVTVDASQNVGIGTSSPSKLLDVAGNAAITGTGVLSLQRPIVPTFGQGTPQLTFQYYTTGTTYTTGAQIQALADGSWSSTSAPTNMLFYTCPSASTTIAERMRIDSSGNVGIGTSSPSARLSVSDTANPKINLLVGTTERAFISYTTATTIASFDSDGDITLSPNNTEAVRVNASGNLLVGTTSSLVQSGEKLSILNASGHGTGIKVGDQNNYALSLWNTGATGTRKQVSFYDSAAGGFRGEITTNGTSTTYATSSDYRLKESIAPMTGALAKVALLKPCTYKWNADGSDGEGFIAHELQAVVPQCVTGEKDAVDAEGNPQYQGIDTSFLVATLTAAIQEQQALITQLQADVAALKGA